MNGWARLVLGGAGMSPQLDFRSIALRVRSLIFGNNQRDIDAAAALLGVDTDALHRSIDFLSPHPTLTVLVAVVRVYAADPSWLLYGAYDRTTHFKALEKGDAITPSDFIMLSESPRLVHPDDIPEQRPRFQLDP